MKRLLGSLMALTILAQGALAAPQCERSEAKSISIKPPPWSANECPVICRVRNSPGGWIHEFRTAALKLKAEGRHLMIDGDCASSCTVAADIARPNVCITPRARLQFHKSYWWDDNMCFKGREDMYDEYSADIAGWIRSKGGFPGHTLQDDALLDMSAQEASAFFPPCRA